MPGNASSPEQPQFDPNDTSDVPSVSGQTAKTYPGYPLKENLVGKPAPEEGATAVTPTSQKPKPNPFRELVGNISRMARKAF